MNVHVIGKDSVLLKTYLSKVGLSTASVSLLPKEEVPGVTIAVGQVGLNNAGLGSLNPLDVHGYVFSTPHGLVVPSLEPSALFSEADRDHWVRHAFRKAKSIAEGRSLDNPPTLLLNPTLDTVTDFYNGLSPVAPLAIDIECIPGNCEITTIAFSTNDVSICIPLVGERLIPYWSPEDEIKVWKIIARLCSSGNPKVLQNYIFDCMILRRHGVEVKGEIDDTLVIANLLNPELPKSLADLGRMYLYSPSWKNNQDYKITGDATEFYKYNASDAAFTLRIYNHQLRELGIRSLLDFYQRYTKPLYPLVLDSCLTGVAIDKSLLLEFDNTLTSVIDPLVSSLKAIGDPLVGLKIKSKQLRDQERDQHEDKDTGESVSCLLKRHTKCSHKTIKAYRTVEVGDVQDFNPGSKTQVKQVLEALGYRIPTKKQKETVDREALLKLNRKAPHPFIENLLLLNKLSKMRSSYTSVRLDDDKCLFSLNIGGTRSGRFSSKQTPWKTGLNIQTLPRPSKEVPIYMRDCFIPDEDSTMVEVDLSQAELRVVAWLSNETKLIELMERGEDVHQYTADRVSEISGLSCPRQLGKRINHASNYGMGPAKFADSCLMEANLSIPVSDAEKLLQARSRTFPAIAIWHRSLEDQLRRTRSLLSPHGRQRYFFGPTVNDEMIREALSFIPQATVVDTVNQAWINLAKDPNYNISFRIITQIHDSLLMSVKTDRLPEIVELIKTTFGALNITINGQVRHIPFDAKFGPSWGKMEKLF